MTKNWFKAAGVRALKTAAQTAVAIAATGTVMQDVNWLMVLSAAALAAFLSILTSLAGIPEVDATTGAPIETKTTIDTRAVAAEKAAAAEENKEAEEAAAEKGAEQ